MNIPICPSPEVWVLLGKGKGGNGQMICLAEALGWPYKTFQLIHNPMNLVPNLLLGATDITLDKKRSASLKPPWPNLVIAASRRATPVALWIRKQSRGHAKLVHLLHVQAPLSWFDLIITLPQYRLPKRHNILHNVGPLNQIALDPESPLTLAWSERLHDMPRPYTVLLVGGNSSSYKFDTDAAKRLVNDVNDEIQKRGGTLLVTTSPRTPEDSSRTIKNTLDCQHYYYEWKAGDSDNNPYSAFLALADSLIVTADSASLLAEASQTGKPVQLFRWDNGSHVRLSEQEDIMPKRHSIASRCFNILVYYGFIKPSRDFNAYHDAMIARGLVTVLGDDSGEMDRQSLDDMKRAVERIRALFNEPRL